MLLLKSFLFVCLTSVLVRTNENDDGFDLSDALKDDTTDPWDDNDGFDLKDAFQDDSTKSPSNDDGFDLSKVFKDDPIKPAENDDGFDLSDALKDDSTEPWDDNDGFDLNDALRGDSTKAPSNDDGLDLSEAFKDDPIKPAAGGFGDSDLEDVVNSDYKPEKTNSKGQKPPTLSDLIGDLVMALIGGTSEQVKRLCFSLLEMFTEQYTNAKDQ